jgi:proliferating cell nuclear antigen PCNA
MDICISDKKRKECFISLFQVLSRCSSIISATFNPEFIHIQGMDKSHVCLFQVKIVKKWFSIYEVKEKMVLSFDTNNFYSIISIKSDNHDLVIKTTNSNPDTMAILFQPIGSVKGEFKKSFKMPLTDYDYEELHIPTVDYDAEFTLSSKQISDMFNQLGNFGNDIVFKCTEEEIQLTTTGVTGEMKVDIPIEDLSIYSIVEGGELDLTYSLAYMNKMCITNKLSIEIDFAISNDYPMKIHYDLEEDSSIDFYIATKMSD